jgi:hypothetical protein
MNVCPWVKAKSRDTGTTRIQVLTQKDYTFLVGSDNTVADSDVPQRDTEVRNNEIREGHLARRSRRAA